jgi:hypothetical protein
VLMKLLGLFAIPMFEAFLNVIPDAPDPVDLTLPWPGWLPFWPFGTAMVFVLTIGVASLSIRFLRWVYGLIPVVQ